MIKHRILGLALLFAVFTAVLPIVSVAQDIARAEKEPNSGIKFVDLPFESILKAAANEKKLIMIDAYAVWCGPCKAMAKKVFTDPIVGKFYNSNFINAKIDMEKGEGVDLAKKYEVRAYPTYLFIAADGELVHKALGYMEASKFIMVGNDALDPKSRLAFYIKEFEGGNRDKAFVSQYFMKTAQAGMNVSKQFRSYIEEQSVEILLDSTVWQLFEEFGKLEMTREVEFIKSHQADIVKAYPKARPDQVLKELYWEPMLRAYATDGPKSEAYKKLDTDFRALKLKDGDKVADMVPLAILEAGEDPEKYATTAIVYYKKHPKQDPSWLNSVAWNFYEHVDSKAHLAVAEKMAKDAMKQDPQNYAVADTYAAVVYKLGRKTDALKAANAAISLGLKNGEDVSGTQALIKKIKELK